jgi:hypothetical protein
MRGLTEAEAGNVAAYTVGLRPSTAHPWTLREIERLLFLRWLRRHEVTVIEVFTRDLSSGHVHRGLAVEGITEPFRLESCNTDQAGASELLDSLEGIEPGQLCERCRPGDHRRTDEA